MLMQISWLLTWFITRLFSIQAPSPKNWVKPRYEAIKKWVPYWFSPTSLPQMGLVSYQIAQPFQSLASVPLMLEIILFFSLDKTHRTCCWKVVTEQVMEAFLHYIACQKRYIDWTSSGAAIQAGTLNLHCYITYLHKFWTLITMTSVIN